MNQYLKKPYAVIWLSVIFIVFIRELKLAEDPLVLNYGDTYYVTEKRNFTILFTIILFGISLIYLFFEKLKINLNQRLTRVHLFLTIIPLMLYPFIEWYFSSQNKNFDLIENYQYLEMISLVLIIVTMIAQCIFIINIITGLYKKITQRTY